MAKQKKIRFGEHAGKMYSEIPLDYLRWLVSIPNDGRRRAFTERTYARNEIARRRNLLLTPSK